MYLEGRVNMGPANKVKWASRFNSRIIPFFGETPAAQITHDRLNAYVRHRQEGGVSATTIHNELSDVMTVLNWASYRHQPPLITDNPARGFSKGKRVDSDIDIPTVEELAAILQHASPHLYRCLVLDSQCGARPGPSELFKMTWADVDLIGNKIKVRSANKGGISYRDIPLSRSLREHLMAWREEDLKTGAKFLIHYHGKPVESLKTTFAAAKRRAGVTRRLRLYDCGRHFFVSKMLEGGADLKSVSRMAGHVDEKMVLRRYQHITGAMKEQAISMLPEIPLGGGGTPGTRGTPSEKIVEIKTKRKQSVG